jgi:hypothetical protein
MITPEPIDNGTHREQVKTKQINAIGNMDSICRLQIPEIRDINIGFHSIQK